jgi:hypothetical protein
MRDASDVGVADDIEAKIPAVAGMPLGDFYQLPGYKLPGVAARSALDVVLTRLSQRPDDIISPFGSYIA